jgi:PAS domain-containing protein
MRSSKVASFVIKRGPALTFESKSVVCRTDPRREVRRYDEDKRDLRKDGAIVCGMTVSCVRKSDGSADYFVTVVEAITARKRAEEELRNSEERWRADLPAASSVRSRATAMSISFRSRRRCVLRGGQLGVVGEDRTAGDRSRLSLEALDRGRRLNNRIAQPSMRRQIIEAPMPVDNALQFRRLERKIAELDRKSAAEFHGELASENSHQIRLHQHGARRQIGHVGRDRTDAFARLQERVQKIKILAAGADRKMFELRKRRNGQLLAQGRMAASQHSYEAILDEQP